MNNTVQKTNRNIVSSRGLKSGFIILAAALFVGVAVFISYGTSKMIEREASNTIAKAVDATVQRINEQMGGVERVTKETAADVRAHLDDPDYMYKITEKLVRSTTFIVGSTVAFEPDYFAEKGLYFAPYTWQEPDGSTYNKQLGNPGNHYFDQEWYAEALKIGIPRWSEPYYDIGGYKVMMSTYSVPLLDENQKVFAILTADVALDDLSGYIRSINPYEDSYAMMYSAGGISLVAPPANTDNKKYSTVTVKGVADNGWRVELVCPMSTILGDTKSQSLRIVLLVSGGLAFVFIVFWSIFSRMGRAQAQLRQEAKEAKQKVIEGDRIIGALSEDFGWVGYIEPTDNKLDDTTLDYRVSKDLMRLIPDWAQENRFSKQLDLLMEHVIFEPDKKQFYDETRRDKVLEGLESSDTYFVNFRILIDGEIKYYQMKMSAVREEKKLVGFVVGLHSVDEQMKKEIEFKEKLLDSSIRNSMSQMQPHFLYNALASIREVILFDPEYASDLVYDFTTHLRACIKSMDFKEPVPFEQELTNIKAYVNIEKMRFGDKLKMEYDLGVKDFRVVALGIQPLVENAIKHGICKRGPKGGTVKIKTFDSGDCIVVQVIDDGVGFDYEQVKADVASGKRDSTGMRNFALRFEKMMNAKIDVDSKIGVGTTITIKLPKC